MTVHVSDKFEMLTEHCHQHHKCLFKLKIIFRSKFCYKLTSHITDEQACLIEPMGVAHNVLERIDVDGKDLVVIGCGPGKLLTDS